MIYRGQVEIALDDETLSLTGEFDDVTRVLTFGSFPKDALGDLQVAGTHFSVSMEADTDTDDVIHYHGTGTPIEVEQLEAQPGRYRVVMQTNMTPIR